MICPIDDPGPDAAPCLGCGRACDDAAALCDGCLAVEESRQAEAEAADEAEPTSERHQMWRPV